jgi:hypothetical protein
VCQITIKLHRFMSMNILLCPYKKSLLSTVSITWYGLQLNTVFQTSKLVQTQNQQYSFLKGSHQRIVRKFSMSNQTVVSQFSGNCQADVNSSLILKICHLGLKHFFIIPKVSPLGVDSLWGDCMFIPADWGS